MDISQFLDNSTPQQFESLCVELLRSMKPETYRIVGTRYVKDGGKDIVGTVDNVPYEVWAECKKHTRPLGLEDISKNVILVISQEINELFFFSTSNISRNAQKHISIVAAKHGLKIAFYYGNNLINALSQLPRFKDDTTPKTISEDLVISHYVSKYENSDKYETKNTTILRRDTFFFIDIFLKNRSIHNFSDITFSWEESKYIELSIKEIDNHISLNSYNDRVIQIRGEVLNVKTAHRIPLIHVSYKVQGKTERIPVKAGLIDPTQLIYFPVIGEKPNKFLFEKITPLLKNEKSNDSYLIDIRGGSGNGKSRLLKETKNLGINSNRRVIYFDAKKYNDFNIIKDLICTLLYIPYNKGNIEFSSKNIANILVQRNSDQSFAHSIYSFVFENKTKEDNLYFVKQAILNFLIHPLFNENYILLFDNVQCLSSDMIDMLIFIIDNLLNNESNCIIGCSTNTEFIPSSNQEKIASLFRFIDELPSDFHITYICEEMEPDDAKSMYIHALNSDNDSFIEKLVAKSGCRPFDIIMLIKYMQEEKIITWQGTHAWYVTSFERMDKLLQDIPNESQKLIKARVSLQQNTYGEKYWGTFKTIIKSLIYFQGFVPIEFFEAIQINDDDLSSVNNSFFIKYDDDLPIITFFHDNIYRFFANNRQYSIDVALAKEINRWLNDNPKIQVPNRDSILYKTYIDMSNYTYAKEYGIKTIKDNYHSRNYHECTKIGTQIIENRHISLSKQENFDLLYIISNSERERVDHQAGSETFYKTYNFLLNNINDIEISSKQYNRFMHDCVNSQINAGCPNRAIEILKIFERSKTLDEHYRFIVFNRYAVAYLAIGDLEQAKNNINKAIDLSIEMNDKYLESIAYSDMAFIYFNGDEDKYNVICYFEKAATEEHNCGPDLNRKAEILQQKALCLLLKHDYLDALTYVDKSIEICEQLNNSFLKIKAMSLKGVIYCFKGQLDDAVKTMNEALVMCEDTKSIVGKIKLYTNLSAIYIVKNDIVRAREYIDIAFKLFRSSKLSSIKHKPLFYNYITALKDNGEYNKLYNTISEYSNEDILNYLDESFSNSDLLREDTYGVIKKGKGIFNY